MKSIKKSDNPNREREESLAVRNARLRRRDLGVAPRLSDVVNRHALIKDSSLLRNVNSVDRM